MYSRKLTQSRLFHSTAQPWRKFRNWDMSFCKRILCLVNPTSTKKVHLRCEKSKENYTFQAKRTHRFRKLFSSCLQCDIPNCRVLIKWKVAFDTEFLANFPKSERNQRKYERRYICQLTLHAKPQNWKVKSENNRKITGLTAAFKTFELKQNSQLIKNRRCTLVVMLIFSKKWDNWDGWMNELLFDGLVSLRALISNWSLMQSDFLSASKHNETGQHRICRSSKEWTGP